MANDPIQRQEFDGYVRRHEADEVAHSRMRHDLRNAMLGNDLKLDARITRLEFWQQRMIGGLAFGALMLGGGGVAAVIELVRK